MLAELYCDIEPRIVLWFAGLFMQLSAFVSGKMFVRAWLQLIRLPWLGVSRRFVFLRSLLIPKQKLQS
jgi:hypothetical protein